MLDCSGFETNGTPEYRRERGILYTNTKIGNSMLSTARSGFDAGRFKGMQVRDRRYPVVDSETGAVMSLVRFGDPMGALSKASLPLFIECQCQEGGRVREFAGGGVEEHRIGEQGIVAIGVGRRQLTYALLDVRGNAGGKIHSQGARLETCAHVLIQSGARNVDREHRRQK